MNPVFAQAAVRFSTSTNGTGAWPYQVKARVQLPAPEFKGVAYVNDEFK
jgi:hypothetical protein